MGEADFGLPPGKSYCFLFLPFTSSTYPAVSKSRVRKDVRVRPPPPAPCESRRASRTSCWPFSYSLHAGGGGRTGEGRRRAGGRARRTGAPLRSPALAGYLALPV